MFKRGMPFEVPHKASPPFCGEPGSCSSQHALHAQSITEFTTLHIIQDELGFTAICICAK